MRCVLVAALVAVALVAGGATAEDPCAQFTHCSQCLHDAYETPVSLKGYRCAWCPKTGACASNATGCPDAKALGTADDQCADMQCAGATSTGNIYMCRGMTQAALFFAVLLLLLCIPYAFWCFGLQLHPWRYRNADEALAQYQRSMGGLVAAMWSDPKEFIVLEERPAYDSHISCPSCHVAYADVTFLPGRVCFWCDIARRAPLPLSAAITASVVSLTLLFGVSLRPGAADPFFALLLVVGYAVPSVFIAGILVAHSSQQSRSSLWLTWGLAVRFRSLRTLFGIDAAPEIAELEHSDDTPLGSCVESQTETLPPAINPAVPDVFQRWMSEQLRPDEELLWWDQPSTWTVLVHHAWMILCYALGVAMGIFLIMVGSQPSSSYSRLLPASGLMNGMGLAAILFFAILLGLIVASRRRLYCVTNKRLVMLSPGPLANVNVITTPLAQVSCITLEGYQMMGHSVATLRWEIRSQDGRQMPQCRMQTFPAVGHIDTLMRTIRSAIPRQCRDEPRAALQHRQLAWYVHVQWLMFVFVLMPLLFLGTGVFTWFLGNVGFNLVWGILGALIVNKGWITIATTIAHDKLAHDWDEACRKGFTFQALRSLSVADVLATLAPGATAEVELQ